jgi:hypothetical protein
LFWGVSLLILVGALLIFFMGQNNYTYKAPFWPLFVVALISILIITSVMIMALLKIRKTIETIPLLKPCLNLGRMVAHALAYIFYITVWILGLVLPQDYEYAIWLIISLFGFASFFCFFLICWHLGSKKKVPP